MNLEPSIHRRVFLILPKLHERFPICPKGNVLMKLSFENSEGTVTRNVKKIKVYFNNNNNNCEKYRV